MLNRQKYLDEIIEKLNQLRSEIESKAKLNLTDGNIHFEEFICGLLNIIYDINLKCLNMVKSNFPGIDLGDEKLGLGFQVTSTKKSQKINHTIKTYIENKCYEKYPNLRFFITTRKQGSYSIMTDHKGTIKFDPLEDIWDFDDIFKEIQTSEIELLEHVHEYVMKEMYRDSDNNVQNKLSEPFARLLYNDIRKIISDLIRINETNNIYQISGLERWEEKFAEISHLLSRDEASTLITFYKMIDELKEIIVASKDFMDRTYRIKPIGPIMDARYSRFVRAYHGTIEDILNLEHVRLIEKLGQICN